MKIILTTCPQKSAKELAKHLVEKKLAGCVIELRSGFSVFWWEGKVEEERESMLVIKIPDRKVRKVVEEIKKIHPYTVPFIGVVNVEKVNSEFKKWLESVVK